jgi:hypothetical protein
MCDLSGAPPAAAESAYRQVALPDYPLWCKTTLTSRWFAAPGKLLRMDGRDRTAGSSPPGRPARTLKPNIEQRNLSANPVRPVQSLVAARSQQDYLRPGW